MGRFSRVAGKLVDESGGVIGALRVSSDSAYDRFRGRVFDPGKYSPSRIGEFAIQPAITATGAMIG
tara:strand:- start:1033 stop:1230 length:198 start_codon:yes stop_codon:yes gene_type:complete